MLLEPILGFLLLAALYGAVRLYARLWLREACEQPAFEAWVRSRPLVAALKCRPGREVELAREVRLTLGRGEMFNPDGGYPWQHYVVTYFCRPLGPGVVGLFARRAVVGRVHQKRPLLRELWKTLGRELGSEVTEIWLHGRLRSPGVRAIADRRKMSWFGAFDEAGALSMTAMIGHPRWLGSRAA